MFLNKRMSLGIFLLPFFLSLFIFPLLHMQAAGQDYPVRPINLVVPYPPGGASDLTCRTIVETMRKTLGQPVVIENKPGGGCTVAYTLVAKAKPDGYTVGYVALGSLINNYLSYEVSYHPLKSFTFIGGLANFGESIVVKSDVSWKTWDELIDYARNHPGELRMGFAGALGSNSISTKWAAKKLGIKWKEVIFPGEPEVITALLGGNVDAFAGGGSHNILVKDGRARMLLALTIDPIPGYPHVPTFKKVFGKDTMNAGGLMAPSGIPEPSLKKLEQAVQDAAKDPGFIKTMEKISWTPQARTAKEFTQDVNTALTTFRDLLRDLDLLKRKE